jgi:hypothetical protein
MPDTNSPHPLAVALIDRLRDRPAAVVLEIGRGSGRNTRALETAGFPVRTLEDEPQLLCAGAISSHALLHGTPASIATLLSRIADRLEPQAPLFATFGSVRDRRYGEGSWIEPYVYAPAEGDERGVPHAFFDRRRLRLLIEPLFEIESLEERDVDTLAGSWAHARRPLEDAVHWFVIARRRSYCSRITASTSRHGSTTG